MVWKVIWDVRREVGVDAGNVGCVRVGEDTLEVWIVISDGRQEDLRAEVGVIRSIGIVPLGRPHSGPSRPLLARPQWSELRRSEPVLVFHGGPRPGPGVRLLDTPLHGLRPLHTLHLLGEAERGGALLERGGRRSALERIKVNLRSRETFTERLCGEQEEVGHDRSALSVLESFKRQSRQLLVF